VAKIKIKKSASAVKGSTSSPPATPDQAGSGSSGKKSSKSAKTNPFSSATQRGHGSSPNPFTKKPIAPALPTFGKKAGPLSTPMGRVKKASLGETIRDEFPTTDTSWMQQGMTVRVKWICESASLGGPTPVEFEGEVKYVDGVWLNMIERAHPHAHAHVMREWIFEAQEVTQ
jgi:hypothetical protein